MDCAFFQSLLLCCLLTTVDWEIETAHLLERDDFFSFCLIIAHSFQANQSHFKLRDLNDGSKSSTDNVLEGETDMKRKM